MNLEAEIKLLAAKIKAENKPIDYPYNIYSGFCRNTAKHKYADMEADEWFNLWYNNTRKESQAPIYLLGPHSPNNLHGCTNIALYDNCGHFDDRKGDYFHGCTVGLMWGLLHAYCSRKDFVLKEQDCLWFGDCIGNMYDTNSDVAYGNNSMFKAAMSLFLVKWQAIPEALKSFTTVRCDESFPEYKVRDIKGSAQYTMGYDRDRPFELNLPFHIQQVSKDDLNKVKHLL